MKKAIVVLMSLLMCVSLIACGKKPEIHADYDTVQDAINAHREGVNVVGKTVKIELEEDSKAGIIYSKPDLNIRANIYFTLISDKAKGNSTEINNIKKGQTVVATIDMIDDHLVYSIYMFAKEYTIYD